MVPHCVPEIMKHLGILSLEIQRMPKDPNTTFSYPANAPYLSVVTPSTHDMSTIRGWWEEDRQLIQNFYNSVLGQHGEAPTSCEPWINTAVISQHLSSPAMWGVFQLQDLLGMSADLRRENPQGNAAVFSRHALMTGTVTPLPKRPVHPARRTVKWIVIALLSWWLVWVALERGF